ncbi:Elongator subunit ELP2 TDEL_0E04900 [Torulaspora delbrueckii]|uniref:Elongator complex protein 2 n=1 Tax=Torulaspora delbrueckii TaxID=4950 RepID=G8ZVT9_TORDE|nr:hypothetical protein TDEL_0E04900 [Torulaspora delbrueckii]CCE92733.1 hypothetical protein TDEL_0E04900 [Torulaspora delbrueckii]
MVIVNSDAIFIGANKQNQVSDYHSGQSVVAFGAGKTIALWKPTDDFAQGVCRTLKGHAAEVTCVKFMPGTNYMVSASEDHHVKIWDFSTLECVQTIEHFKHTIVTLAVNKNLIAIGSADGLVSIWIKDSQEHRFGLGQEFSIRKGILPLTLSISHVINDKFLLAVGGTSMNVFIYSFVLSESEIQDCQMAAELDGHEDWVKSLAFRQKRDTPEDFLLASGSQDRYIRLWRIRVNDAIEDDDEDEEKPKLLSNKKYKFEINEDTKVVINFEALIMGHDDWISSLKWHQERMQLLAATADTSLMIWEPDEAFGVWVCASRLGEISSKGASTATGSSGGFWSCLWFAHEDKDFILTNGKTGSWRVWASGDGFEWTQRIGLTGSTKTVTDVAWSPSGEYLLTTSLDQTTRLFAPWLYDATGKQRPVATWHEFSRPQIHGYDMMCIQPISDVRFVSGGDEKILRSFDLPKGVSEILEKLVGCNFKLSEELPESASLPALGLSNKAINQGDVDEEEEDPNARETNETKNISYSLTSALSQPPVEDQLQRHLLWPEIEKLYGHGYEMSCVDVSSDGSLIASACRSNSPQHAVVRIFDAKTWQEIKPPLFYHDLTITRLKFSKDSKFLLSVSRDRKWAIWERDMATNTFGLKYSNEKAHARIIWDSDWAPSDFANMFITGSRDKSVKVWKFENAKDTFECEGTVKIGEPVTAVSVYDKVIDDKLLIAVGTVSGKIHIFTYSSNHFELIKEFEDSITPADRVSRLEWSSLQRNGELSLGVGSEDSSTRIYSINL